MNIKDVETKNRSIFATISIFLVFIVYLGYNIPLCIDLFNSKPAILAEFLISIPLVFILSIIFHEAGHLILGLISHFRFLSFEVLGLKIIKINGKIKLKRGNFVALGQCLLGLDKEKRDIVNTKLYLSGGIILNGVLSSLGLILSIISVFKRDFISPYASTILFCNLYFLVNNAIPLNIGGIYNDALNIRLSKKYYEVERTLVNSIVLNTYMEEKESLADFDEDILLNDGITTPAWYAYDYPFIQLSVYKNILNKDYYSALSLNTPRFTNRYYYPKVYFKNIVSHQMYLKILTGDTYEYLFKSKEGESLVKSSYNNMVLCGDVLYHYDKGEFTSSYAYMILNQYEEDTKNMYNNMKVQKELELAVINSAIEYIQTKELKKIEIIDVEEEDDPQK